MEQLPPKLQELAAGYVLGNLDPEELQEFQKLSAQFPQQEILVAEMQELMGQLPFSLTPEPVPHSLGDRIFNEAAKDLKAETKATGLLHRKSVLIFATVCTLLLAVGSAYTWNLRQELRIAEDKIREQNATLARLQALLPESQESTLQIKTSPKLLQANWNGISQVLEDHLRAEQKGASAVEIQAKSPPELFQLLQKSDFSLPQPTPSLSLKNLEFLGGSICKFDKTQGVRVMYETQSQQPISFYQLKRAATPDFPLAISEQLLIQNSKGPNLMIWGNDNFLFAIVADLSSNQLEALAANLELQNPDQAFQVL